MDFATYRHMSNTQQRRDEQLAAAGIGYTIATGQLFCSMPAFQAFAERLLERPILTHEFGSEDVWSELRTTFETKIKEALVA